MVNKVSHKDATADHTLKHFIIHLPPTGLV